MFAFANRPELLVAQLFLSLHSHHELLNVDNHYDSLMKYAIYISILAIPARKIIVAIFYIH